MRKSALSTRGESPAPPARIKPPFEVEIKTGNRAGGDRFAPAPSGPTTESRPLTPLAALRRERARFRARLFAQLGSVLVAGLVIWGTAVWWQPLLEGNVVVRVNGKAITLEQVDREIRLSKALSVATSGKAQAPARPSMIEQLILAEAKVQAVRGANFSVTDQDVEQAVNDLMAQAGTDRARLEAILKSYGLKWEDLKASVAQTTLVNLYIEQNVANGIVDQTARLNKMNRWQTDVVQKAQIERFRSPTSGAVPRVGSEAPDFALLDLAGQEIRLSSLRGRGVLVNFWAPWCPPCRAEMPLLERSYKSAQTNGSNGGFELLGVATQSKPDNVAAFAREFGITFPVLLDSQNEATDLYRVGPLPTSFFIDKEGIIRAVQIGQLSEATLVQRLELVK